MNNITTAVFSHDKDPAIAGTIWQYDYGITLRLQGADLPPAAEVHFALQQVGGTTTTRIGVTHGGVTDVVVPDSMLINDDAEKDYKIYVWVYLADTESGRTERRITIPVRSRPAPEAFDSKEESDLFKKAIEAVNESAVRAENAVTAAQSWAVGATGTRSGEDVDNAKYYARKAQDAVAGIDGTVIDGKQQIDDYVREKESELKGETGNVYFAAFAVKSGRLKMYSDPNVDKVRFTRKGSRLAYRLQVK